MEEAPARTAGATPDRAYLTVTRLPDGRYCVIHSASTHNRRSYTRVVEQVIHQAQHAGYIPVRTDDDLLRQHCQDADVPLI